MHLLHTFKEIDNQNHLNFQTNVVATFYGGLSQYIPLLKYAIMGSLPLQEMSDTLKFLDYQSFLRVKLVDVVDGLETYFKAIIAKENFPLKEIAISECKLEAYTPRVNTTPVSQHIKRIIFHNSKINFASFRLFLNEFKSLDYIEFDNCTFSGDFEQLNMSNTNIKSMKMKNLQKTLFGYKYNGVAPTIIIVSIYFTDQNLTRHYSIVDDILIEATQHIF